MTQIEVNMAARKVQKHTSEIDEAKEFIEQQFSTENRATKNRIFSAWQAYVAWRKG